MHVAIMPSWFPTRQSPWRGQFILDQATALRAHGHQVGLMIPASRPWTRHARTEVLDAVRPSVVEEVVNGLPALRLTTWGVRGMASSGRRQSLMSHVVDGYIKRHGRPDIIHAHSCLPAGELAVEIGVGRGIPTALTEHASFIYEWDLLPGEARRVMTTLRTADRVLAVSRRMADRLRSRVDRTSVDVVPNVVDTELFAPLRVPATSGAISVSIVAGLTRNKRIDLALHAVAALADDLDVRLHVAGDGPERKALQRLAVELGLADRVRWLGPLAKSQVADLLRASDALISCSDVETFGVTVVEAFACGIPVLATRSGGPEELVSSTRGVLVPPGSRQTLTAGLHALVDRLDEYEPDQIRRYAVETCSPTAVVRALEEVYASLLSSPT